MYEYDVSRAIENNYEHQLATQECSEAAQERDNMTTPEFHHPRTPSRTRTSVHVDRDQPFSVATQVTNWFDTEGVLDYATLDLTIASNTITFYLGTSAEALCGALASQFEMLARETMHDMAGPCSGHSSAKVVSTFPAQVKP